MKLIEAQISMFQNIVDSTPIAIERDITCLVGKNESGKTTVLEALRRVKPAQGKAVFSVQKHYPAWRQKQDERDGAIDGVKVVRVTFELEDKDRAAIEARFGPAVAKSDTLTIECDYKGKRVYGLDIDEVAAVTNALQGVDLPHGIGRQALAQATFGGLKNVIKELRQKSDDPGSEAQQAADAIETAITKILGEKQTFERAWVEAVDELVPAFFYFADYSELPARVKIRELLEADEKDLDEDDLTALSLLRMAGTDDEYLLDADYETRKRELENVANYLSTDVLQYWSQNRDLRVQIDISQENITTPQGQPKSVLDELKIRLYDSVHWLSLPFDQRSSGFRWFFSFLAAFSRYETGDRPVVILLDEPALALHARAQRDFLHFIDERLAKRHQVIYTTHSPFMIQPGELQRVRLVEDRGRDVGSKVTADVLSTDRDTVFPLQGALGYDLVQHILIAPHNLVVEGTADFTYLTLLSDHLKALGRTGLDDRWSIKAVGGIDLIPSFVALLGGHLDLTVLVDSRKAGHQKLTRLARDGYLEQTRIVAVGQVVGDADADIEDVFAEEDYLGLYNRAFGRSYAPADLEGSGTIVSRLARREGVERFDHGRPADVLLRHRDEILPTLRAETLDGFERLMQRINETFPA